MSLIISEFGFGEELAIERPDELEQGIRSLEAANPSNLEELKDAFRRHKKLAEGLYRNKGANPQFHAMQERLLRLRDRFADLQTRFVLGNARVRLGTYNQYQVPNGRVACACTVGVAVSALLHGRAFPIDRMLMQGIEVYLKTASEYEWSPNDPRHGHLSWELQAERAFEGELFSLGPRIESQLKENGASVYLRGLEELVKRSEGKPCGCIMLVGPEFYGIVINESGIHIFDSHGSPHISRRPINPAFLITTTSLEHAAAILELRRAYEPEAETEYNRVVFYPVGPEEKRELLPIQPVEEVPLTDLPEEKMEEIEAAIEVDPFSSTVADLSALFFRDYIYPAIFTPNSENQESLALFLSDWMKNVLPQMPPSVSGSGKAVDTALVGRGLDATTHFFRDYQRALSHAEKKRSGLINQLMFWQEPDPITEQELIAYMAAHGAVVVYSQEEEIVRDLLSKLIRIAAVNDPQLASELEKHIPPIICEMVNLILSPDFFYVIAQAFVDQTNPLAEMDQWIGPATASASDIQIPFDIQKKLATCISEVLNLGDPRGTTWVVKKIIEILIREIHDPHLLTRVVVGLTNLLAIPILRQTVAPLLQKIMARQTPQEQTALNSVGLALSILEKSLWLKNPQRTHRKHGLIFRQDRTFLGEKLGEKVWNLVKNHLLTPAKIGLSATEYAIPSVKKFATKLISRVFELTQRPQIMKLFLYQYLIKDAIIPHLESIAPAALTADPVAPIPEAEQLSKELAIFIHRILELYVRGKVVRDDLPLNQAIFTATAGLLEEAIPRALTQVLSTDQTLPLEQQRNRTELFSVIAHLLDDYSRAISDVRGQTGAIDLFDVPEEQMIDALSKARLERGASSIQINQSKTLKALTELTIQLSATQHPDIARRAAAVCPEILQTVIDLLVTPQLFCQFLESALDSHDPITTIPDTMEATPWDEDQRIAFNQTLLRLGSGVIALGEPGALIQNFGQLPMMLIRSLEKQMPQILSKMLLQPSRLSNHVAHLNGLRMVGRLLWKTDLAGQLKPTIKPGAKIDRQEQVLLAGRLEKAVASRVQNLVPLVGNEMMGPASRFAARLVQNLFYLTQSPKLLQTIIYQYILQDFALIAMSANDVDLSPDLFKQELHTEWQPAPADFLRSISLPEDDLRKHMEDLQILARASAGNLSHPLQMIDSLKTSHTITHDQACSLIQSLDSQRAFETQMRAFGLQEKDPRQSFLDTLAPFAQEVGLAPPEDPSQLIESAQEIFSLLGTRNSAFSHLAKTLKRSINPMNELAQILTAFQQITYWRKETQRLSLHIQRDAQTMPERFLREIAPQVAKVYQEIAKRASAILAPLPKMFRAQLTQYWQQELDATLFPDIPKLGEPSSMPYSGAVLTDSVQGNQMKLDLIRAAEKSIVMSGCYLGGQVFDTMLDLMSAKLRSTPELNILLTGSEHMIQPSNWNRIKAMRTEFNDRFQGVFLPEVFAKDNPITETFGLSCNHVKALVVDGGKYFLIGGSGLEDRWASVKGDLPPVLPIQNQLLGLRPTEPLSFRDMDFVFTSPSKNSIGERLHLSIAQLISKLSSLDERLEMVHAFAPQGFTLPECSDEARLPIKALHEDLRMTAFLTGPEAAGNAFEDSLIDQISKAEDSIVIAHMYFIPSPRMLQELINAHNRGVRIAVIANKDKEKTPLTHELFVARGRHSFLKLLQWAPKPNIELYEYDVDHTTYHKKVVVIDGKILATGSSNIGYKSMQGIVDWEDNLIIESENYAIDVLEVLERDMELSRQVPHEELLQMGMGQLIQAHLQSGVEYFL